MSVVAGGVSPAPELRKSVLENGERTLLKRGPGGSSFMTCEGCGKSIGCAVFDLHKCSSEKQREEQVERWAKADMEYKKRLLEEEKRLKDASRTGSHKRQKQAGRNPGKATKKEKEARDPDMPKRPTSSYMLFMNDFRPKFKEENPEVKGVAEVGKAGGAKWNSMSVEEKQPYVDEAARLKAEHAEQMRLYTLSKGSPVPEEEKENANPNTAGEDGDEHNPEH